jgi:hypothetical protein
MEKLLIYRGVHQLMAYTIKHFPLGDMLPESSCAYKRRKALCPKN